MTRHQKWVFITNMHQMISFWPSTKTLQYSILHNISEIAKSRWDLGIPGGNLGFWFCQNRPNQQIQNGCSIKCNFLFFIGVETRIGWKSFGNCLMFKCFDGNFVSKISFFLSHKLWTRLLFKDWCFRWSTTPNRFYERFYVPTCNVHVADCHSFGTIKATSCYTQTSVFTT